MSSPFETPSTPSPETHGRAQIDAFLSREDLRPLNRVLGSVFRLLPAADIEAERKNFRASAVSNAAPRNREQLDTSEGQLQLRAQAFNDILGSHAASLALEKATDIRKYEKATLLQDYQEFLTVMTDHPELRPKLLSKICYMNPGETPEEQAKTWPERQAFNRFLTEFYGREKVIRKDKNGQEKGFLSLEGQADLVEAWNLKGNWGFTEREFDEIRDQIPEIRERMKKYEDKPLVAVTLVPYLGDEFRTFSELRTLLTVPQEKNYVNSVYATPTPENLRLLKGIKHKPGLRFEILGLGDNQGKSPESVRNTHSPGPQILALAASSPEWVQMMDGYEVPFAWASGYEVNVPVLGGEPWRHVPYLRFQRHDRLVLLRVFGRSDRYLRNSVPSLRE